ncbi:hypothetical protein B0H63DRAFT_447790 [Podospora didyma]|uniref:BTB domain-containing protein n=1 Tax=Podospora didyma TaxID=330526 RepID=A0AAE0U0W4_9PEZI|nr:hypothetical protein B0H63DRAFT_447790 [Podospora didyma]
MAGWSPPLTALLRLRIPFFRVAFLGNCREHNGYLELSEDDPAAFELFVQWLYAKRGDEEADKSFPDLELLRRGDTVYAYGEDVPQVSMVGLKPISDLSNLRTYLNLYHLGLK